MNITVIVVPLPENYSHDHFELALKTDHSPSLLRELNHNLKTLIMKIQDATDALNELSTAADSLSLSNDKLIAATEKLIAALGNAELPADAATAVTAAKAAIASAKAAGKKADDEVAKVDTVLPTPAPEGEVPNA